MSKYRARLGSRKYYKRCFNQYAWRFAITGVIQSKGVRLPKMGSVQIETNSMTLGKLTEMINDAMRNEIARSILADRKL